MQHLTPKYTFVQKISLINMSIVISSMTYRCIWE